LAESALFIMAGKCIIQFYIIFAYEPKHNKVKLNSNVEILSIRTIVSTRHRVYTYVRIHNT